VKVCTAYELDAAIDERLQSRVVAERVENRTVIHDILPAEGASFDERAALTALLGACRPRYETLCGWTSSDDAAAHVFLRFLGSPDVLGARAPVTLASFGPRALDKIELDASTA
jgi:hypothetical protein